MGNNNRMTGGRAKVLYALLGDEATATGDDIAEMVNGHALKDDRRFYEAAQRAGRSARFVRDVLNLLSQGRVEEAEAKLGMDWNE